MKPTVIVICGPTASGKTALSIELAKRIDGEIISADSMQIYQGMDIGSAKVTEKERQGIQHYLIDILSPEERYSVADFKRDAKQAIENILAKGKTPIVVGGTGLYINALIYEIDYQDIPMDKDYREQLQRMEREQGLEALYQKALEIDPEAMQKISSNDAKRIMRILEIYKATGKTKTEQEQESRKNEVPYNYKVFVIDMERDVLYSRINQRVDGMIEEGLVEEVEGLLQKYKTFPTAMQAIGYKEVRAFLQNQLSREEMIETIKQETRRYAKRQLTWFRKDKQFIWLDGLKSTNENIDIILEESHIE